MTSSKIRLTVLILLLMNASACVSVNLPISSKGTPAKDVKFVEPQLPFQKLDDNSGDQSWKSKKTANIISFLTDCGGSDPNLESLQVEIESALQEPKTISERKFTFNDREALESEVQGKIDGISVRVRSVVFKKSACNYLITLSGQDKQFAEDLPVFNKFLEGFIAP